MSIANLNNEMNVRFIGLSDGIHKFKIKKTGQSEAIRWS